MKLLPQGEVVMVEFMHMGWAGGGFVNVVEQISKRSPESDGRWQVPDY